MDQPVVITWYMSRRLPIPLDAAVTALDTVTSHRRRECDDRSVRLTDALAAEPIDSVPGVARQLRGHLVLSGFGRGVAVELELGAWSRRETELGLRPVGRLRRARAECYWAAAAGSLDGLAAELMATAAPVADAVGPLRRAS